MFLDNNSNLNDKNNALINALDLVGIGIDIVSIDHQILFQNRVLKEKFGISVGEPCYKRYIARDSPCEFCPMEKAINNNRVEKVELKGADGHVYDVYSAPFPDKDGNPSMVAEVVIDVTEHKQNEQLLKESEEKFKIISEQNLMGISIVQDNVIKYLNKAMSNIYGYSIEEVYGWKPNEFFKLFAPESLENVKEQAKKKQNGDSDQIAHYIIQGVKKSGDRIWVENFSKTIQYNNRPADLVSQKDITEKRKFEFEIRDSEEKYRALFEGANDAIFIMKDYKFVECNKKTLEMFGFENKSYILGLFPWDVSPPIQPSGEESKESAMKLMNDALNGNSPRFTWIHRKNNSSLFNADVSLNRVLIGEEYYLQAIVRDVTEKVISERKLKESEGKYHALFDESPVGILLFDENFNLVAVNEKIPILLAEVFDDFVQGKNFIELIRLFKNSEELSKIFVQRIDLLKKGHKMEPIELRAIMPSGVEMWFHWQSSTIHLPENKSLIQIIMFDLTEKKLAEILIAEERQRIQKLNELRQELMTRISHELKTPITSVYGALQVLMELHKSELNKEVSELVNIIKKGSKRLKKLVESLLSASKLDNKKQELQLKEENILNLARKQVYELDFYAKSRNIKIEVDLPPKFMFLVDKYLFEQIITNILSNAINNTLPGGFILVSFNETKDRVDLIICDTGVGITQEEKSKLFKKFGKIERYGKGDDVYIEGVGLGLYISKEIVELHGGQILVESEGRNKGSTFTIRLLKKD